MSKKTIVRTLFYQNLILFGLVCLVFVSNSEYWGVKGQVVAKSMDRIFFPIEYNDQTELKLMAMAKERLWVELDCPDALTCYNEKMTNQEWYECDYHYETPTGGSETGHYRTRIKWKTWESYYDLPETLE